VYADQSAEDSGNDHDGDDPPCLIAACMADQELAGPGAYSGYLQPRRDGELRRDQNDDRVAKPAKLRATITASGTVTRHGREPRRLLMRPLPSRAPRGRGLLRSSTQRIG